MLADEIVRECDSIKYAGPSRNGRTAGWVEPGSACRNPPRRRPDAPWVARRGARFHRPIETPGAVPAGVSELEIFGSEGPLDDPVSVLDGSVPARTSEIIVAEEIQPEEVLHLVAPPVPVLTMPGRVSRLDRE